MARNYRLEIIEALGGKCMWHEGCEVTDPDMLDVDHTNGGGNRERVSFGARIEPGINPGSIHIRNGTNGNFHYYKNILENVGSGRYQVLCANHHRKKDANERRAKKAAKKELVG